MNGFSDDFSNDKNLRSDSEAKPKDGNPYAKFYWICNRHTYPIFHLKRENSQKLEGK